MIKDGEEGRRTLRNRKEKVGSLHLMLAPVWLRGLLESRCGREETGEVESGGPVGCLVLS
jgi:hypothetical protein